MNILAGEEEQVEKFTKITALIQQGNSVLHAGNAGYCVSTVGSLFACGE